MIMKRDSDDWLKSPQLSIIIAEVFFLSGVGALRNRLND